MRNADRRRRGAVAAVHDAGPVTPDRGAKFSPCDRGPRFLNQRPYLADGAARLCAMVAGHHSILLTVFSTAPWSAASVIALPSCCTAASMTVGGCTCAATPSGFEMVICAHLTRALCAGSLDGSIRMKSANFIQATLTRPRKVGSFMSAADSS